MAGDNARMSAFTLYSDKPTISAPAKQRKYTDPGQHQAAAWMLDTFRRQPPGAWSDNRWEQVAHYRDVIYVAIRSIMDLISGADFCVSRKKRKSKNRTTFMKSGGATQAHGRDEDYIPFEDYDHPLARLTRRPNEVETMGELAAKLVLQNRLTGVAPLWCVPNNAGRPVELWALKVALLQPLYQQSLLYPHGAWRVTPYTQGGWSGFLPGRIGSAGAVLPGEEVKRWMDPHPLIDWDGFSPLTAGAVQLDVLESIDESRKSAMDNGLQLDAVLIAPGIGEHNATRIQDKFENRHRGSRNAKKFAVVDPGDPVAGGTGGFDLKTLSQTSKDMEYDKGWEQMVKFALALFGVPASVAGLSTTTSYSELYAALRQFHHRQQAFVSRMETWFTKILAWPWCSFPDEYIVRVKLPPLDDPELREKVLGRQLQYDLLTYNEARIKDDMDPVEGGDVPVSLYVQMKQQELAPEPAPGEGQPGAGGGGDPLAAMLGGGGPTAGAVPQPDNKAAEGTKPPTEKKALPAGQHRKEGEKWQGDSGKWFTLKDGKTVPTSGPGGEQPGQWQPAAGDQSPEAQDGRLKVAQIGAKLRDGQEITDAEKAQLEEGLKHLTPAEKAKFEAVVGEKNPTNEKAGAETRSSRRDAAGKAWQSAGNYVDGGWHEGDMSPEKMASQMDEHAKEFEAEVATVSEHMAAAGATEKETADFQRVVGKHRAAMARNRATVGKTRGKVEQLAKSLEESQAAIDQHAASEPQEPESVSTKDYEGYPDEPEEPEEPDAPEGVRELPSESDYDDPADYRADLKAWQEYSDKFSEYEKAHADWEKEHDAWEKETAAVDERNNKLDSDYEKDYAKWEAAHDAWELKGDRLQAKVDDLEGRHSDAEERYNDAAWDYANDSKDGAEEIVSWLSDFHDEVHEREADDDEEGNSPPVRKAANTLSLSAGGALVPEGRRKRKPKNRVKKIVSRLFKGL